MKRLLTALLLVAVLAGTAAAAVAKPERVLAVEWQAGGGKLRWVSPTTMRPVGAAALNVGGAPAGILATSPDGALAAIGGGENGRLRFVRLDGLRPAGLMWLGGASAFKGIWSAPDRLVVLVGGETAEVVVVDPAARRVLHREPLPGLALGVVRAGNRLLTLLAPRGRIGTAQLVVDRGRRNGAHGGPGRDLRGICAAGRGRSGGPPGLARPRRERLAGGRGRRRPPGRGPARDDGRDQRGRSSAARPRRRRSSSTAGIGRAVWLRGDTVAFWGSTMGPEGPSSIGVRLLNVATGTAADARRVRARGGPRRAARFSSTAATSSAAIASTARSGSPSSRARTRATCRRPAAGRTSAAATALASRSSTSRRAGRRPRPHREADHHLRSLDSPDGDGAAGRRG